MVRRLWYHRWKILGAGLVLGLELAVWLGSKWLSAAPGSSEDVFARLRIGMTKEEVVAVLRSYDLHKIEGFSAAGETKSGHFWAGSHLEGPLFNDLPPSHEI